MEEGVTVIEVPPTPYGCQFIACLTHDVDFAAIRDHLLDRAFFGFLYRASLGSFLKLLRGDMTFRQLVRNLLSIASLPLVYLGLVKDFWNPFDKYVEIEGERAPRSSLSLSRTVMGKRSQPPAKPDAGRDTIVTTSKPRCMGSWSEERRSEFTGSMPGTMPHEERPSSRGSAG